MSLTFFVGMLSITGNLNGSGNIGLKTTTYRLLVDVTLTAKHCP